MKIATANPNKDYRWYRSLRDIRLEAHLTDGERVIFIEKLINPYDPKCSTGKRISEDTVKKLFPTEGRVIYRPFHYKQNPDFYAVLMRRREKYKTKFQKLVNDAKKHDSTNRQRSAESTGDHSLKRVRRRKGGGNMSPSLQRRRPPKPRS